MVINCDKGEQKSSVASVEMGPVNQTACIPTMQSINVLCSKKVIGPYGLQDDTSDLWVHS